VSSDGTLLRRQGGSQQCRADGRWERGFDQPGGPHCAVHVQLSRALLEHIEPLSGWAVYIRIALTRLGVRFGFACNISATAPETTGVAIEVPLWYITWSAAVLAVPVLSAG